MIAAPVTIHTSGVATVVAFVNLTYEDETRVRWAPGRWRCDRCGEQAWPTCAHARAVANSNDYQTERNTP